TFMRRSWSVHKRGVDRHRIGRLVASANRGDTAFWRGCRPRPSGLLFHYVHVMNQWSERAFHYVHVVNQRSEAAFHYVHVVNRWSEAAVHYVHVVKRWSEAGFHYVRVVKNWIAGGLRLGDPTWQGWQRGRKRPVGVTSAGSIVGPRME